MSDRTLREICRGSSREVGFPTSSSSHHEAHRHRRPGEVMETTEYDIERCVITQTKSYDPYVVVYDGARRTSYTLAEW
jgi:hypothetical protein